MTHIKICGITRLADFEYAVHQGADMIGFIFAESPRRLTRDQAMTFTELLKGMDVDRVPQCIGVFVNPSATEVAHTVATCRLQGAQISRVADFGQLAAITEALAGVCYPVSQGQSAEACAHQINAWAEQGLLRAPFWLPTLAVDAYHPDKAGGTGNILDVALAKQLVANHGQYQIMVAGGLTPDNVGEMVRQVRPYAVDVSGGVEESPGKKDHGKIRAFIQAVREADRT
jgi:phosphoribosylanthranilate isomerase